jgi:hypothetical protein
MLTMHVQNHIQSAWESVKPPQTGIGVVILVAAIATLACVAREMYIWKFHLRGVPGPFRNTFTCNWTLFRKGFNGTLYEWERRQNEKHGRSFVSGPTMS